MYKYALLSGDDAGGVDKVSTCMGSAVYGNFTALTNPIKINRLPEGKHLICAKGRNAAGTVQKYPSAVSWVVAPRDDTPTPTTDPTPLTITIPFEITIPGGP